jgi:hypothetical protein
MKVLYLDLVGGAAGDMILAALADAGAPIDRIRDAVRGILPHVSIELAEDRPAGLRALRADVMVRGVLGDTGRAGTSFHVHGAHAHSHDPHVHRPHRVVRGLIEGSALSDGAKNMVLGAFQRLADAEARAHGVDPDDVVFHEVGADDAIADIVGVAVGFESLGIDEVVVSPVPMARGLVTGAHGPVPLPGPAVLHILMGVPTAETSLEGEMVTPTGAALVAELADRFGSIPAMTLEAVGVGCGHKRWPDRPNVVRAMIGAVADRALETSEECVVEANIDDMNPEQFSALERALFEAGALDVWIAPIHMKKGRIGSMVSALVRKTAREALVLELFRHSTTLGVRFHDVGRARIPRRVERFETRYGAVRVKVADRPGGPTFAPEHDDCERIARDAGVPIRVVYEAALEAAWTRETLPHTFPGAGRP